MAVMSGGDAEKWVAFVQARLDEDEALAKAALEAGHSEWGDRPWAVTECSGPEPDHEGCPCIVYQGEYKPFEEPQVPPIQYVADAEEPEHAAHIARHDPARALREVAAKRAILAEHGPGEDGSVWCRVCDPAADMNDSDRWYPCKTVRLLAPVWSGHPDYAAITSETEQSMTPSQRRNR